jgi:hypothetical protein
VTLVIRGAAIGARSPVNSSSDDLGTRNQVTRLGETKRARFRDGIQYVVSSGSVGLHR